MENLNGETKMKKCLMLIAVVTLALCAAMADTEIVDGITWTYTVSGGKASVGGGSWNSPAVPKSTSRAILTIPSALGGCPVTGIGNYAFSYCSGLAGVTIPSSVTSIGEEAFFGCTGLTSMTIPSSMTSIGAGPFAGCDKLASIEVDANNETYASQDGVLFDIGKTTLIQCPGGKEGA